MAGHTAPSTGVIVFLASQADPPGNNNSASTASHAQQALEHAVQYATAHPTIYTSVTDTVLAFTGGSL